MITLYARDIEDSCGSSSHLMRYEKGDTIYYEGDPAKHWYEVVSGIVRTCRFYADGHRQLTGFFYADDVFGVERGRHTETAEAVTHVILRRHGADELTAQGRHDSGRQEKALQRALDSARQCIFLLGHRTAADRVAAFLLTAHRSGSDKIELAMTRSDIADHLGLTMHTVSRTFSDLARRGLIALDGPQHVRLLNLEGLRELAGELDREGKLPSHKSAFLWDKGGAARRPT